MTFAVLTILLFQQLYYCQADVVAYKYGADFFYHTFSDVPASFGPSLSEHTVWGILINAIPANACDESLKPPPNVYNSFEAWILLVPRYTREKNCTFEQKIQMAQLKKYNAVIVYNVGSNELVPMTANNSTGVSIPSVFVSQSSGLKLKNIYTESNSRVAIMAENPFTFLTYLLILFCSVVGLCFIVMIIFTVINYIKGIRRQGIYLWKSELNKIPTCKFQKGNRYETCAVCLEDYIEGEKLRVLPCNHVFHMRCIDPWLTKNTRVCPICKRKVWAHDEHPEHIDSDRDAEDTTPLIRSSNRSTQGGTFEIQNENLLYRAMHSISHIANGRHFFTSSDPHNNNRSGNRGTQGGTFEIQNENLLFRVMHSSSHIVNGRHFFTTWDSHNNNTERQNRRSLPSSSSSGR